jgi:uncharacterized membrane protein YgcG
LGLRNLAHCPVDLNLMPKSSKTRQQFHQKKPYLAAAALCLILIVFAFGWFEHQVASETRLALGKLEAQVKTPQDNQPRLKKALLDMKTARTETEHFTGLLEDRYYWGTICTALRDALMTVEEKKQKEINQPVGIWIERLAPLVPPNYLSVAVTPPPESGIAGPGGQGMANPGDAPEGGLAPPGRGGPRGPGRPGGGGGPGGGRRPGSGNSGGSGGSPGSSAFDSVLLTVRTVNLSFSTSKPDANTLIAETLADELRGRTNLFNAANTKVIGTIAGQDSTNFTINFDILLKLARPMKL